VHLTVDALQARAALPGRYIKCGVLAWDATSRREIKIVLVDLERNLLGVNGAVPGPKGSLLVVKEARKQ
jgi:large subunit ribosomal protein L3